MVGHDGTCTCFWYIGTCATHTRHRTTTGGADAETQSRSYCLTAETGREAGHPSTGERTCSATPPAGTELGLGISSQNVLFARGETSST